MRALLVPQHLANGKLLKQGPPKNIMVCFEDGAMELEQKVGNADGKGKKV